MMEKDELYMTRAIELAKRGLPSCAPNPMVGCVIVHDDRIIGEGFHKEYGGDHAEVMAINSVKNEKLLKESTLYVSLEPCNHFGKTPPCTKMILQNEIPRVVIGSRDPFETNDTKGVEYLTKKGIKIRQDVLTVKCNELNKRFFTYHKKRRPYIILKWAQSVDGFMAPEQNSSYWITNDLSNQLNHHWRSTENAILIGKNTAQIDNPRLTTRLVSGKNPLRLVIDPQLEIDASNSVFSNEAPTCVFNSKYNSSNGNIHFVKLNFDESVPDQIIDFLHQMKIQSLIIEGGRNTLDSFIKLDLWDEARIFTGTQSFNLGLAAPSLKNVLTRNYKLGNNHLSHSFNS